MERVNLIGIELEGYYDKIPDFKGSFKTDSSVSFDDYENGDGDCDGSCTDECECYSYCECEQCLMCENCDNQTYDCNCDTCLTCDECEHVYDNCECDRNIRHLEDCDNTGCSNREICDDCKDNCNDEFMDNQELSHNCDLQGNAHQECDHECGCDCSCDCDCEQDNVGEYVSRPLELEEVTDWIEICHPKETNDSCGAHVHVSLKSACDYMDLMEKDFYDYYIKEMTRFGKEEHIATSDYFWKRIEGVNYCYARFQPKDQRDMVGHYEDPRYAQINYCYNVDGRKTVEFRLLPCFDDKELMKRGILKTINIVESYLNDMNTKENKMKVRLEI